MLVVSLMLPLSGISENDKTQAKEEKLKIPKFVKAEQKELAKHIKRLEKYNDSENTIGFLNDDGTETAYIFQSAMRYKDKDGQMKDKDNAIVKVKDKDKRKKGYDYENEASDVKLFFDAELAENGVLLQYAETEINMKPLNDSAHPAWWRTARTATRYPTSTPLV